METHGPLALDTDYRYHLHMLQDSVRLAAYRDAFREVCAEGEVWAEIGAGTGVLTGLAVSTARIRAHAVEYFGDLVSLAKFGLRNEIQTSRVTIHRASSFQWSPAEKPVGLFSETIGSLGPEENMVEMYFDFVRRHPDVRKIIPSTLKLYGQEIRTDHVVRERAWVSQTCASAGEVSGTDFQVTEVEILKQWARQLQCTVLNTRDTVALSAPRLLKAYRLGYEARSEFSTELAVTHPESNAMHLWFDAELSPSVTLSSHFSRPVTHWRHCYVMRPSADVQSVAVSYNSKARRFDFKWSI